MVIENIKRIRHKLYIEFFRKLPVKNNKIIMWANSFKQYGCSPKYITEYLLENYPNKYDIVWVFEDNAKIPEGLDKRVRIVRYFSIEYLKELHTAKVVICNMRTGDSHFWKKRNEQIYMQTWHSSLRLKKIEKDAEYLDPVYIDIAKKDSAKIDIILSGCDFSTNIFKNSFWYNGPILKSGTPRCDILINDNIDVKNKVYQYFNIKSNYKILLYAPTFRDTKNADMHGIDFAAIKKSLENTLGGNWIIMYRFHPNIIAPYNFEDNLNIDATKYPDMQELIVSSDILLTDYSSCMFDMAIAKKKCILYAPDIETYKRTERGLYFDIGELPFKLAKSNEELINIINSFDEKEYVSKLEEFMRKIGSYEDGHATERVVKYIEGVFNE